MSVTSESLSSCSLSETAESVELVHPEHLQCEVQLRFPLKREQRFVEHPDLHAHSTFSRMPSGAGGVETSIYLLKISHPSAGRTQRKDELLRGLYLRQKPSFTNRTAAHGRASSKVNEVNNSLLINVLLMYQFIITVLAFIPVNFSKTENSSTEGKPIQNTDTASLSTLQP